MFLNQVIIMDVDWQYQHQVKQTCYKYETGLYCKLFIIK